MGGRHRWLASATLAVLAGAGTVQGFAMSATCTHKFATSPAIVYGTAWKKDKTEDLVFQAVSAGFRGIDTACQPKHYFEPGVGAALARLAQSGIAREEIFLQTKYTPFRGQDPNNAPYDPKTPLDEQVRTSFEVSLRNLKTEYVDSWVLHSPLPTHRENMLVWRAMEAKVEAGLVGQLGISNCYDLPVFEALYKDAAVKPSVLQNRFYADTGFDRELRAFCKANGIAYQSFWTLTANPEALASAPVKAAARRLQCTTQEVFFAFVRAEGITPLCRPAPPPFPPVLTGHVSSPLPY
jgi:diketogulonate reductase-like aldo/keto reductase